MNCTAHAQQSDTGYWNGKCSKPQGHTGPHEYARLDKGKGRE